ncbi:MAG: helix-turn-helix domain-containing protein [Patescibacteria group bacterium]
MQLSILSRFGLNKNDIAVYDSLLELGRSKTGAIITHARISSSSTYASLNALVRNGLVSYQVRNNVKYYQAEIPTQLIDETRHQTLALEKLSKEITSLPITKSERNEVNVYQGIHGIKRAHEIMANEVKPDEDVNVTAFSTYYARSKQIRRFFASLDKKLITQNKCKMRMIIDKELRDIVIADRPTYYKKYDFRTLPSEYFNPCGLSITDSMVVVSVWSKDPIAFTIRNKAVIDNFRANFNVLWSKGKK